MAGVPGERLRNLITMFKEFMPLILDLMECLKEMNPAVRQKFVARLASHSTEDALEQQELVQQVERLVA